MTPAVCGSVTESNNVLNANVCNPVLSQPAAAGVSGLCVCSDEQICKMLDLDHKNPFKKK